jgi:hypothetical protein
MKQNHSRQADLAICLRKEDLDIKAKSAVTSALSLLF